MTAWEQRMRDALLAAEAQFAAYADHHLAKEPPDRERAAINIHRAMCCHEAAIPPDQVRPTGVIPTPEQMQERTREQQRIASERRPQPGWTGAMQWRPISEAPKDGTWILGTNADKIPCVVGWDEIYGCWGTHYPGYERKMKSFVPTHWMPLPAPPGKDATA